MLFPTTKLSNRSYLINRKEELLALIKNPIINVYYMQYLYHLYFTDHNKDNLRKLLFTFDFNCKKSNERECKSRIENE